jgi:SAM-dependent methyltransferase
LGRDAWVFLSGDSGGLDGIFNTTGFNRAWLATKADLRVWEFIVLDRFQTPTAEFVRWAALAPLIGIDEGGPCRNRFDFLIDALPGFADGTGPNIAGASLLPLPEKRKAPAPQKKIPLKVLISCGQEDAAALGPAAAQALAAKNSGCLLDITLIAGGLHLGGGVPALAGVKTLDAIPSLAERLAEYDLLVTHYGLTAFEAVYAGVPVALLAPTAYHQRLAQAAGFYAAGVGRHRAAALSRLLFKKGALNTGFLDALESRRAALAIRHRLEHQPRHSLAELVNGFSPQVSRECPVCGAPLCGAQLYGAELAGTVHGRGSERGFRRCPRCKTLNMIRLNPPPLEYGKTYFFELYQKQYGKTYLEDFPHLTAMGKQRLARIQALLPPSAGTPSLLDIGCAYGPFLAAAKEAGFAPCGIDPAEDAVRYVTQTLGIPATRGFFPDSRLADNAPFDAVTLWFVIEHFQDCVPALAEIRRILKPGGTLAFATPSFSGISGRARLASFLEQSPADHWTIWSPESCKKALAIAGFTVKKMVISGHHPERFPLLGRFAKTKKSPLYGLLVAVSRLFSLGDTFEVYAEAKPLKAPEERK